MKLIKTKDGYKMTKERVTVQDIADALGLSRTTVSKVLNGAPNMPEKTVNKVLQMAKKLNYKQFSFLELEERREASAGNGGTFALFANYIPEHFHIATSIMASLEQEMRKYGYSLTVYMLNPDDVLGLKLPRNFRLEQTDAILCIELFSRKYSEMVCSLGKPVLFFDSYYAPDIPPLNANILLMESRFSTFRMLNSILASNPVRHVGFIGDIGHCISFHERYEGFLEALESNNIPFEEPLCITEDDSLFQNPGFLYRTLSNMERLPELFFCANDLLAWRTISALKQMGVKVSRDILICGFDDTMNMNPTDSTLTTVKTPSKEMGVMAARILMNQLENPGLPCSTVYLTGEIRMRASTLYEEPE